MTAWTVVSTAPGMGLLPVLLVVVAAVSVYIVPLRVGLGVVVLNTVVIAWATAQQSGDTGATTLTSGFYLLIQLATLFSSVSLLREQRMRRELTEAHVELQAASVLLSESARTAERLRISRDLHDLIGHQLTVLALELETARHRDGEQAREHVERANGVARELLADVRSTVGELRVEPLDLAAALTRVVRDLPGLEVQIDVAPDVDVGEEQAAAFVRAVQEIVTNALRHAGARTLRIEVSSERGGAVLSAVDDGAGARKLTVGNGLRGLGGTFRGPRWKRLVRWNLRVPGHCVGTGLMTSVVVVDDQTLVRQGIRSLLEVAEIEVIGEADDGRVALDVISSTDPDVVLLDLRMPGYDGIWTLDRLRERDIAVPVLVLTTFDDDALVLAALRAGARGYLLKDVTLEQLTHAVRTLADGGTLIAPSITDRLLRAIRSGPSPSGAETTRSTGPHRPGNSRCSA